jgi:hypothetical protein
MGLVAVAAAAQAHVTKCPLVIVVDELNSGRFQSLDTVSENDIHHFD